MIEPANSAEVTAAQYQAVLDMLSPMVINVTPVEGQTITMPATSRDIILNIAPASNLNNLGIVFPAEANTRIGQRYFVASTKAVANATFSGPTTVNNNIVVFAPGDNVVFFKNNTNTISRLT